MSTSTLRLAAVACAALVLAGCTPPASTPTTAPSGSPTTAVSGQCALVRSELTAITADLQQLGSQVPGDPQGALATLTTVRGRVDGLIAATTDKELQARLTNTEGELTALIDTAREGITLSTAPTLLGKLEAVRAAAASVQEYCRQR